MNLRHALFVADIEHKKQKKSPEDESDLEEDAVVEREELCKARTKSSERRRNFVNEMLCNSALYLLALLVKESQ